MGFADDFDPQYAIDTTRFWSFLENTQKEELEKIQRSSDWKLRIVQRFDRMVKKFGLLRILRKGLEVEDAHFTILYPLPLASTVSSIAWSTHLTASCTISSTARVFGMSLGTGIRYCICVA